MPQVQREREVADRAQHPSRQQVVDAEPVPGPPGDQHHRRGQRRPERGPAGERAVHLQQDPAGDQRDHAAPAEHGAGAGGQLRPVLDPGDPQRQQPAERELPDPRRGVEVGQRLVHQRQVHRVRERRPADGEQCAGEPPVQVGAVPPGRDRDAGHDQRREQVELPLDGQRPEVLDDARRVVAGRVVDRVVRQLPVLQEQQRRDRLPDGRHPPVLRQQPEPGHHPRGQDHRHRRQEPGELPSPGGEHVDPAPRRGPVQATGDEEAGDQEEHVDAAGDPADPDVVDDHQQHRQRAQALQLRTEPGTRGTAGRRSGAGGGCSTGRRHEWQLLVRHGRVKESLRPGRSTTTAVTGFPR